MPASAFWDTVSSEYTDIVHRGSNFLASVIFYVFELLMVR